MLMICTSVFSGRNWPIEVVKTSMSLSRASPGVGTLEMFIFSTVMDASYRISTTPLVVSGEGAELGDVLCARLGATLGTVVGEVLGCKDGLDEASDDGSIDGTTLGSVEGCTDGACVGIVLGPVEGWTDGPFVGSILGPADGIALGSVEGEALGPDDGTGTGTGSAAICSTDVEGSALGPELGPELGTVQLGPTRYVTQLTHGPALRTTAILPPVGLVTPEKVIL